MSLTPINGLAWADANPSFSLEQMGKGTNRRTEEGSMMNEGDE